VAEQVAHLSPVSTLFAAFLGYDPIQHLVGAHVLATLPVAQQHVLTGRSFFPGLISAPFQNGLHAAFDFAIVASLLAAGASWMRGGKYVYSEPDDSDTPAGPTPRTDRVEDSGSNRPQPAPVTVAMVEAAPLPPGAGGP
jgi:hypothetical protein